MSTEYDYNFAAAVERIKELESQLAALREPVRFQTGLIDQLHFIASEYPEHQCGRFTDDLKEIGNALREALTQSEAGDDE